MARATGTYGLSFVSPAGFRGVVSKTASLDSRVVPLGSRRLSAGVNTLSQNQTWSVVSGAVAFSMACASSIFRGHRPTRQSKSGVRSVQIGMKAHTSAPEDDGARQSTRSIFQFAIVAILAATAGLSAPAWAAEAAASSTGGGDWFEPVVNLNAGIIDGIDNVVGSAGLAVVLYTILIKVVTYPLNQVALRSSALMQLVSPQVQEIQRMYKEDEANRNSMLKRLYESVGVNAVGGCLPALVQLPILIALFRAIGKLASQDEHFKQGFLWIPSLAGPAPSGNPGLDWLLRTRYSDHFEPLVGWTDAGLYFVMPLLLIAAQFASQAATGNKATSDDQAIVQTAFPLFIGFSSLVTPQAVGLYWLTNTAATAAQMSLMRTEVSKEFPDYKRILDAVDKEPLTRYTRQSKVLERKENASEKAVRESIEALGGVAVEKKAKVSTGGARKPRKRAAPAASRAKTRSKSTA